MIGKFLNRWLSVGDKIPALTTNIVKSSSGNFQIQNNVNLQTYFKDKKVVIIGFPGAFTPVCTGTHIPQFVEKQSEFKAKNIQLVGFTVNDAFVLKQFAQKMGGSLDYIADDSGALTKQLEAGIDLSAHGLGYRTRRFTAFVQNGVIKTVNDEQGGAFTDISTADTIFKSLSQGQFKKLII